MTSNGNGNGNGNATYDLSQQNLPAIEDEKIDLRPIGRHAKVTPSPVSDTPTVLLPQTGDAPFAPLTGDAPVPPQTGDAPHE